jgi:HSP20 family protein
VAFARWDPIRDLLAIQQQLDHLAPTPTAWMPPVDVLETPHSILITAEVPGVARDDIQIQVSDGWLLLAGTRRDHCVPCEQYHRVERGHGEFQRSLELPTPVDGERVTADLRDGVLTITCPKSRDAGPRRVTVT